VAQRGPRILMVSQRANRHYGRPRWCAGGRDRGIGVSRDEREKERERERSSQEMVEVEEQHSNQYRASRAKPSLDYSVCRSLALNLSLSLSLSLSLERPPIFLSLSLLGTTGIVSLSCLRSISLESERKYNGCTNALQRR